MRHADIECFYLMSRTLEKLMGDGYEPASDTCLSAFVRLLKEAAEAQGEPE